MQREGIPMRRHDVEVDRGDRDDDPAPREARAPRFLTQATTMLKGIPSLLTPDLLHALASMGHGDEIAIVDANFPAASLGKRVITIAGAGAHEVLDAVLGVLPLDTTEPPPAFTMEVGGDADRHSRAGGRLRRGARGSRARRRRDRAPRAARVLRARARRVRDRAHRRAAALRQHPAGQGHRPHRARDRRRRLDQRGPRRPRRAPAARGRDAARARLRRLPRRQGREPGARGEACGGRGGARRQGRTRRLRGRGARIAARSAASTWRASPPSTRRPASR